MRTPLDDDPTRRPARLRPVDGRSLSPEEAQAMALNAASASLARSMRAGDDWWDVVREKLDHVFWVLRKRPESALALALCTKGDTFVRWFDRYGTRVAEGHRDALYRYVSLRRRHDARRLPDEYWQTYFR